MGEATIPLLILGGSDREPATLPPGADQHPLSGCKGADLQIGGRPLILLLVDRLRSCGAFGPIYVAGPREVYERVGAPVPIIDTNAGFGENLRRGLETVRARHPGRELAVSTCDILPDPEELRLLVEDYRETRPSDLWFPIIRAPESPDLLGESAWKPQYRFIPRPGESAVRVLPGHLTIADVDALRLKFIYRLFDAAYRSRNRPISYRRSYMLRQVIWSLLVQDFFHVTSLRLPTLTWEVIRHGIPGARRLKEGSLTLHELEDILRIILVKRRHRKRLPERRIRVPILDALSFARDIDTVEEAQAIATRAL